MKKNIIANFLGRSWSILVGIVAIPFYIRLLGIEAYGLVGFFSVLISSLALLEFGLSTTINREIARFLGVEQKHNEIRDLSRSLEVIYWLLGIALALIFWSLAPVIAEYWINTEHLSKNSVKEAVGLMGICIAFQWPVSLYNGGMMGLERQVSLNIITAVIGTIRAIGAIALLTLISPSIFIFFIWQVVITILHVILIGGMFWRYMPRGTRKPTFQTGTLRSIWGFTFGMGMSGILTFMLSNLDKVILSKILLLSDFGNYNVASAVNNASKMSASSVFTALFPRFAALYQAQDDVALKVLLHKGTQFISLIVFPLSAIIVFYSHEIIYIWSQNILLANSTALILSILVLGSAINVSMGVLGDLAVANGLSSYVLYQNLISVVFIVPLMVILALNYGGLGASIAWLVLNVGYLIFSVPILIKKTQPGELSNWYIKDFGKPFLISFAIVGIAKLAFPLTTSMPLLILLIVFLWGVAQVACLAVLPHIRDFVLKRGIIAKR